MPVIRRGDEQRVHILVFQHAAKILFHLRRFALRLLRDGGSGRKVIAVHIHHILELHTGQRGELIDEFDAATARAGRTAADTGDGKDDFVTRGLGGAQRSARHQSERSSGGERGSDKLTAR